MAAPRFQLCDLQKRTIQSLLDDKDVSFQCRVGSESYYAIKKFHIIIRIKTKVIFVILLHIFMQNLHKYPVWLMPASFIMSVNSTTHWSEFWSVNITKSLQIRYAFVLSAAIIIFDYLPSFLNNYFHWFDMTSHIRCNYSRLWYFMWSSSHG